MSKEEHEKEGARRRRKKQSRRCSPLTAPGAGWWRGEEEKPLYTLKTNEETKGAGSATTKIGLIDAGA